MIVMDFDDTLYHDGIEPCAVECIREKRKAGAIIGVLSGSGLESVLEKAALSSAELLLNIDFIGSSNGALMTEPFSGRQQICLVPEEQVLLLGRLRDEFARYSSHGRIVDTGYSVGLLTTDECLKDEIECMLSGSSCVTPSRWATGISAVLITKYDALDRYCALRGLTPVVLAIGDSENDLPMFRFAKERGGISALVGNRRPGVGADIVATAPYGAGVAEILTSVWK